MTTPKRVVLAGNPNAGKTTLFNALTGARARTGNYPGITVERRSGNVRIGEYEVAVVDVPGAYSLSACSAEEIVVLDEILPRQGQAPDLAVLVCDASALDRHLYFALQVIESGVPALLCLNLIDEARSNGVSVDAAKLTDALGVPVVAVSARTGEGLDALRTAISTALSAPKSASLSLALPLPLKESLHAIEDVIRSTAWAGARPEEARIASLAKWALLSIEDDELEVPSELRAAVERERKKTPDLDAMLIGARYAKVEALVSASVTRRSEGPRKAERIDAVLTHPVLGFVIFIAVMTVLFQALFAWSTPFVDVVESMIGFLQDLVRTSLPDGPLTDLLADGVVAGVGNVLVFVPQIAMLSLFIVLLEDSGYLARVAFVIDRVMGAVGLHGRAFVPLLSGFACAVPAVMATRTLENRRDRLITMLALPFMSCSARLPVYALVVAVVFPRGTLFHGIEAGVLALLAMYLLSVVTTLLAAAILRRTVLRGPRPSLVLELPPYRWPAWRSVLRTVGERTWSFIASAGTVIAAITIVLWALLTYPRNAENESRFAGEIAAATTDDAVAELEHARAESRMESSVAGTLGHVIEPAIAPLGFDWKIGIGLIASFAAREVLVGTLGIVYGVGEEEDETSVGLRDRLRHARRADGSLLFTPLTGLSLMVFFVLAAQCMSTLAAVKRESGSWRWAMFLLVYMNVVAYVASLIVYQGGRLLGYV
jgi:ferrous iron transport protein B